MRRDLVPPPVDLDGLLTRLGETFREHRASFGIQVRGCRLTWRDYLSGENGALAVLPKFEIESTIAAVLAELKTLRRAQPEKKRPQKAAWRPATWHDPRRTKTLRRAR